MKTRSKCASQVSGLSLTAYGGVGLLPSSGTTTRFGPSAPRCSHTDDEPGPPLKAKHTGRDGGGSAFEFIRGGEDRGLGLAALVAEGMLDDGQVLTGGEVAELGAVGGLHAALGNDRRLRQPRFDGFLLALFLRLVVRLLDAVLGHGVVGF